MRQQQPQTELFPTPAKPPRSKLPLPTFKVPAGTKAKLCGCSAAIYLVEMPSGKWMPVHCGVPGGRVPSAKEPGIGIAHFVSCPFADSFRKRRRRA